MTVIVREQRKIGGKELVVKIYKSKHFVTQAEKNQAEKLDHFIEARMKEIVRELKEKGLVELKGKKGVVKLWYEVGKCLSFVMDKAVVPEDDREFIWQALYDHSGELNPGKSRVDRPESNYFRYCYNLAQLEWDLVRLGGDWTSWVEFFDSKRIREDRRIIDWLISRSREKPSEKWLKFMKGARQDWIRRLTKPIRHRFQNRATTELNDEELFRELDEIFTELS
jgi:hypothetical protein